jgi:SEC-C motif domain protein
LPTGVSCPGFPGMIGTGPKTTAPSRTSHACLVDRLTQATALAQGETGGGGVVVVVGGAATDDIVGTGGAEARLEVSATRCGPASATAEQALTSANTPITSAGTALRMDVSRGAEVDLTPPSTGGPAKKLSATLIGMAKNNRHCPCGLDKPYAECCGRIHSGEITAATAEALMRSRYSAFAVGDEAYLSRSWHPETRPTEIDLDPNTRWTRLEILGKTGGGLLHTEGTVEFRARYRERGHDDFLEENSRFVRNDGTWVYFGPL